MDRIVIKKWDLSSIMKLSFQNGFSSRLLRLAVDSFESFDEFSVSKKPEFVQFLQESLFIEHSQDLDDSLNQQFEICQKNDYKLLTIWDEDYPVLLRSIDYPPVILFVKGSLQSNDASSISVVGTRKCSQYGRLAVEHFTNGFASNNIIVTSGLAYGIDSLAHQNTIKSKGITYAVIASGLDEIMPAESRRISDKIVESGGAIISEYKCGTKALPAFFPQRNRIISGISRATLVIESAEKGGSLITAKFAFDQGREVFAVPGGIFSEKSKGTNLLINQNIAQPALSVEQMLEILGFAVNEQNGLYNRKMMDSLSFEETAIMDKLSHEPLHIDILMEQTNIDIPVLLVKLLEMEFKGIIRQLPGKYYIRSIS